MTIQEAAERFGYNARTLRYAVTTGALPALRAGKTILVREEDVRTHAERTGHSRGRPRKQPPDQT